MIAPQPLLDWLPRAVELGALGDEGQATAYWTRWSMGEVAGVKRALIKTLTTPDRLSAINEMAFPDLVQNVEVLEDGPSVPMELWNESLFAIEIDGRLVSPFWLAPTYEGVEGSALRNLAGRIAADVIELSVLSRTSALIGLVGRVGRAVANRPVSASELAYATAASSFLKLVLEGTPGAEGLVRGIADAADALDGLRQRLDGLMRACWHAVGPRSLYPDQKFPILVKSIWDATTTDELDKILRDGVGEDEWLADAALPQTLSVLACSEASRFSTATPD